jgi:hypothetical protein
VRVCAGICTFEVRENRESECYVDNKTGHQWCFVEFLVNDDVRFQALCRVFAALKEDKDRWIAQVEEDTSWWGLDAEGHVQHHIDDSERMQGPAFRSENEWRVLFDNEAPDYFRKWSTPGEREAFLQDWESRPVAIYSNMDPKKERPWDLSVMLRTFENGEYALIACRIVNDNVAHLEFDPLAYPYGGTDCMKQLIMAFGFDVIGEDDGTGYYRF